jgi:hypothetical protein
MLKRLIVLFLLAMLTSITFAQNDSRDFNGYFWYDDGIQFTYSLSIAGDAVATFLPATAGSPEFVKITFQDYQEDIGWIPTGAEIHIMLTATLPANLDVFANALSDLPEGVDEIVQHHLQFLELADGVSISTAQTKLVDFQTGTGLRFVTMVQDSIDTAGLFYRFVGTTTDNHYLVTAIFPTTFTESDAVTLESVAESDFTPNLADIDSVIASLTVSPPDASLFVAQTNGQVQYEGIQFTYDTNLAYRIEVTSVAPIVGAEAEQTMFGVTPGYTQFSFVGYPAPGNVQLPNVFVFPVVEFPGVDQRYGERLLALRDLLKERPELTSDSGFERTQNPLPILPLQNAAQVLVAQPQYIRFGNGEGVRYITFYSQSFLPLNSADLFYVFTGMSDDGAYAIGAIFPLEAGFLPVGRGVYDIGDWEQFSVNYQTYLDGLLLQIDVMASSAYLPQVQLLDAVITSVSLE